MKTQYYTATSIDGYIADADHALDWLFQFGEVESMAEHYPRFVAEVGAVAMGSSTYRWLLEHESLLERPERWPYRVPTWVFSRGEPPRVAGADLRVVRGDVAPVHAEMATAANGKNVWIVGGGDLAGQFVDRGLLDELILTVAPVALGAGAPLLPRRVADPPLELIDVERHGKVFVVLTYRVPRSRRPRPAPAGGGAPLVTPPSSSGV